MLFSEAFNSLSGKAHVVLIYIHKQCVWKELKSKRRGRGGKYVIANDKTYLIEYGKLTKKPFNMAQSTITRVVDELLAKGFITVVEQGGSKKGHASIYGLSEKYMDWKPGDEPVETRRPFSARGFCSKPKQGD